MGSDRYMESESYKSRIKERETYEETRKNVLKEILVMQKSITELTVHLIMTYDYDSYAADKILEWGKSVDSMCESLEKMGVIK